MAASTPTLGAFGSRRCGETGGGGETGVMFGVIALCPPFPFIQGTPPLTISPTPPLQVALQKHMEGSAKQFATWRVEREKEVWVCKGVHTAHVDCICNMSLLLLRYRIPPQVVQLRRQNRRNTAHIQQLEALQAKQNAVLQVWKKV